MNPFYSRTPYYLNYISVIVWWILPLLLIRNNHVKLTNFVLYKLIELILLIQFLVTPLTYNDVVNRKCDPDFLLRYNYTGDNSCSNLPSVIISEVNCQVDLLSYLITPSGFISGLSLYFAFIYYKQIGGWYHLWFIILQFISLIYWFVTFHILLDPAGPCLSSTSAVNIARITLVFTPYIIIFSIKSYKERQSDIELDNY